MTLGVKMDKLELYGLDKELAQKALSKYDPEYEREAMEWIFRVLGEPIPENSSPFEILKDGIILCKLVNSVCPTKVTYSTSTLAFKQVSLIK